MVTSTRPDAIEWVLLSYKLPREPSTPRIAVWRRLRRLGVAQISDGLVALPLDARNREQLEWVADEVIERSGRSAIWIGVLPSPTDERRIAEDLANDIAKRYREIVEKAEAFRSLPPVALRAAIRRLRRELRLVRGQDYFPPPEREEAVQAVEELAALETVQT